MTEITDLSPTDSSNTEVTGESLNGAIANMGRMDNTLQAILGMFGRWTSSDTIASAGTTNIGGQAEAYLTVTGTTTITSFGTIRAGTMRFLRFSGALILTHNATSLILPTGANIVTAAGDTAVFVSEGSGNWKCLSYQRATGAALSQGSIIQRAYNEYTLNASITTVIPVDDTIPLVSEGTELVALAGFTPTSTTSRIRVRFQGWGSAAEVNGIVVALFAGSTCLAATQETVDVANYRRRVMLEVEYIPGSVSPITFQVRAGCATAGTVRFNGTSAARLFGGASRATLIIEELQG